MRTTFTTKDSSRIEICVTLSNKEGIPVKFVPPVLFGNVGKSTYTTCNDEIAAAVKSHPYFGSIIFLKSEESEAEKVVQEQNTAPADYAAMCNQEKPIETVEDVTTVATAVHWLQSTHSAVWSSKKIADIKTEAAAKYNTLFPNL